LQGEKTMFFEIKYTTHHEPGQATGIIQDYFLRNGYKKSEGTFEFTRGNRIFSAVSITPRSWPTVARIHVEPLPIQGSLIQVTYEVNAKGQMVFMNDKRFWDKEIAGLAKALSTDDYQGKCTPWPNSVYFGIITLVFMALGLFLGYFVSQIMKTSVVGGIMFVIVGFSLFTPPALKMERRLKISWEKNKRIQQTPNFSLSDPISDISPAESAGLQPALAADSSSAAAVTLGFPDNLAAEVSPAKMDESIVLSEAAMNRQIRSWAIWSGLFGIIDLISSHFTSDWAWTLILVTAMSVIFPAPAMFILYGIILIWVAVNNISGGNITWIIFAIFQIILGISVFRNFSRYIPVWKYYRNNLDCPDLPQPSRGLMRSANGLPITGFLLSAIGFIGSLTAFILEIVLKSTSFGKTYGDLLSILFIVMLNIGMIGFGVGLGSMLSAYKQHVLSILAMIAGSFVILIWLGLILLSILSNLPGLQSGWLIHMV
jgi:hypothetical protein